MGKNKILETTCMATSDEDSRKSHLALFTSDLATTSARALVLQLAP